MFQDTGSAQHSESGEPTPPRSGSLIAYPSSKQDLPDSPRSPYAAGPIRSSSDREQALIEGFLERHAEYARLSAAELVVLAETYRDDDDLALRASMRDEGVDLSYSRESLEDDTAVAWSDEA